MVIAVVAILIVASVGIGIFLLNSDETSGDREVIDSRGRTISVPNEIDSIFCMKSCSLELISYFDSVDKVCALDSNDAVTGDKTYTQIYKEFFESLDEVDVSNAENIIILDPAIIISSTVSVTDLNKEQETFGIPVYAINADLEFGSDDWFEQIERLGKLLNEEDRADELISGVRSLIADITKAFVTDISGYACGMMFYGSGNFLKVSGDYLPFIYSGVTNVMPASPNGQPYNTTIEEVLVKEFDYIFIDGSSLSVTKDQISEYIGSTTLGEKDALQNENVYVVLTYKKWGTQWDNQLINCFFVAYTVNADGYDWTFEEKANEVLQMFYKGTNVTYADLAAVQTGGGCRKVTILQGAP